MILPWGQHKALSSLIHGRPTKAVLRRSFADIDISTLPTVMEGKEAVKAKLPKTKGSKRGHIYKGIAIGRRLTPAGSWKPYGILSKPHKPTAASASIAPAHAARAASTASIIDSMQPETGRSGKTGKGDGSGGGAASTASALKSDSKSATPPIKKLTGDTGKGNGPERRRKNMWVPVERRRQGPPRLG